MSRLYPVGRKYGSAISSLAGWNSTASRISARSSSGSHPTTAVIIVNPSSSRTMAGAYGTTNDIGVAFPPDRAPVVIVVYTHQPAKDAKAREDIVAHATRAALAALKS